MNLSHDSLEFENAFWIIADPNKPFPSSPLRPFQFCQLQLLLFLRLWSRRFAFFPHTLANLELDFFTVLVPWPIMIWNLKYIHLPFGKQICTFPVSQFMVKAWVDWMPGITSSRSWEGFCVGRLFSKTIDLLKILTPSRSRIFSVLKRVIFDGIKFHMSKCIVIWSFS